MSKFVLNTIESAVHDIKEGKIVIVVEIKTERMKAIF